MVEVELADGSLDKVTATLWAQDVELSLGGWNPADADGDAVWKMRLFNLGFLLDTNVELTDEEMLLALQDFQAHCQIDLTGELDDATKAKLVEVYGC
jgi:hypothetical protein